MRTSAPPSARNRCERGQIPGLRGSHEQLDEAPVIVDADRKPSSAGHVAAGARHELARVGRGEAEASAIRRCG